MGIKDLFVEMTEEGLEQMPQTQEMDFVNEGKKYVFCRDSFLFRMPNLRRLDKEVDELMDSDVLTILEHPHVHQRSWFGKQRA